MINSEFIQRSSGKPIDKTALIIVLCIDSIVALKYLIVESSLLLSGIGDIYNDLSGAWREKYLFVLAISGSLNTFV